MKNKMLKKFSLLIVLVLVISLILPSLSNNVEAKTTQSFYLSTNSCVITVNSKFEQSLWRTQWVGDANGTTTNLKKNVTWKSSNKKVATVNKKGIVTAKAKGKAIITVTYKNKTYKSTIYVVKDKVLYQDENVKITTGTISDSESNQLATVKFHNMSSKDIKYTVTRFKVDKKYLINEQASIDEYIDLPSKGMNPIRVSGDVFSDINKLKYLTVYVNYYVEGTDEIKTIEIKNSKIK